MGAQSKDRRAEEILQEEEEKKMRRLLSIISPSAFLTVFSGAMLFSARQAVAMPLFNDAQEMTRFLSLCQSAGSFVEFLMNPIFGKLADSIGRKKVMPFANIAVSVVRFMLFLLPNKKWPIVMEQVVTLPVVTSFFTTYRATLGDHLSGVNLARANAEIGIPIGLSVIAGPLVASWIMSRSHPKNCYLLSVICAFGSLLNIFFRFEESLPVEQRRPLILSDMQPFSFMKLMRLPVVNRLMLITGCQTASEGRSLYDFCSVFLKNDLDWSWYKVNFVVTTFGVALVASGLMVKPMLQTLGLRRFTTFSNTCNFLQNVSFGCMPPFSWLLGSTACVCLGMAFSAPGGRKRDAAESLIMKLGAEAGFGNGFISGSMMNMRALVNVLAPLYFGWLYNVGSKRKFPALVFLGAALTILLSELAHLSISNEDLGLDENGQLKASKKQAAA